MVIRFPTAQPSTVAPLVEVLIAELGPLVPLLHRDRILEQCVSIELRNVASIGLEVTLPPGSPACDVSILLAPGLVPPFAHLPIFQDLAARIESAEAGSTWWELDTSDERMSVGAFIRLLDGVDAFSICREAVSEDPGLASAVDTLKPVVRALHEGGQGLLGVFPDRLPAAAAALVPLPAEQWRSRYASAREKMMVSADGDTPIAQQLSSVCDVVSVAVACDTEGRTGTALEFGFADRIQAMLEGRWATAITNGDWGVWQEGMELLLKSQGVHTFSDFLPLTLISGIDHVKITPDGRLKAYVGILPLYRGVGINGLAPGTI